MTRLGAAMVLSVVLVSLQGCGGNPAGKLFVSWDDFGAGDSVRIDGEVRHAPYTADLNTGAVTPGAVVEEAGQMRLSRDGASMLTHLEVRANAGSVEFDEGDGDDIDSAGGLVTASTQNGEDLGVFADPDVNGYNYQTYGAWITGVGTAAGNVGVGSFGNVSSVRAGEVPNAGAATYEGGAIGLAVDAVGTPFFVEADATVMVNFVDDDFTFSTTNSTTTNINTLAVAANPGLDLTGQGDLTNASLSGAVDAVSPMSGTVSGSLYGPGAPEVGGTFYLSGAAGEYAGSFGAVEVP